MCSLQNGLTACTCCLERNFFERIICFPPFYWQWSITWTNIFIYMCFYYLRKLFKSTVHSFFFTQKNSVELNAFNRFEWICIWKFLESLHCQLFSRQPFFHEHRFYWITSVCRKLNNSCSMCNECNANEYLTFHLTWSHYNLTCLINIQLNFSTVFSFTVVPAFFTSWTAHDRSSHWYGILCQFRNFFFRFAIK